MNQGKSKMLAQTKVEELSQMLQVALKALSFIGQPAPVKNMPNSSICANDAMVKIREIRQASKQTADRIESGEIASMTTASKKQTPPVVQLADQGEIVFSSDHDLYFHQCCGCGLIHEVLTEWDIPAASRQEIGDNISLTTKWTRRDTPPTRAEMAERGIEIEEV